MIKKSKKTLIFVKGMLPSTEAFKLAESVDGQVAFRNINALSGKEPAEKCDAAIGFGCDVPPKYKEAGVEVQNNVGSVSEIEKPAPVKKAARKKAAKKTESKVETDSPKPSWAE